MPDCRSYLCFDFGLKRIGVAIGNDLLNKAQELKPIAARDGIPDWQVIEQLLHEWKPDLVVVGKPLNMDGTESDMTLRARKFCNRIKGRFNIAVDMMDERLSSFEAKQTIRQERGATDFGKYSADGRAAGLILESWLAQQAVLAKSCAPNTSSLQDNHRD